MYRIVGWSAALLLAISAPAQAEELDPAAIEAARELVSTIDLDRQLSATAQATAQTSFTTVVRALEERHQFAIPTDLEAALRTVLMEHTEVVVADLRRTLPEATARIYARYFTVEELRELTRIQANPVMVKFQQIMPQFLGEIMQVGAAADAERLPELLRRVEAVTQEWLARQEQRGVSSPRT